MPGTTKKGLVFMFMFPCVKNVSLDKMLELVLTKERI